MPHVVPRVERALGGVGQQRTCGEGIVPVRQRDDAGQAGVRLHERRARPTQPGIDDGADVRAYEPSAFSDAAFWCSRSARSWSRNLPTTFPRMLRMPPLGKSSKRKRLSTTR